jgi:hypothetical protein
VREYLALTGRNGDRDDDFAAGEDELVEITKSATHVRNQDNGLQLWRARAPKRFRLLVSTDRRSEGSLPQLVRVLSESDAQDQGQGTCAVCGKPCPKRNKHCREHQTKR